MMRILETAIVLTPLVDHIAHIRQLVLSTKPWFLAFEGVLGLLAAFFILTPFIYHIQHMRQLVLCAEVGLFTGFAKDRTLGARDTPLVDDINHA